MDHIKSQFPIFTNLPRLVYLDSAATSQKPQSVISSISDFYSNHNANVHRGLYPLSETATDMYEESRRTLASFIGANPKEIIFTSNATDGLNLVAHIVRQLFTEPKVLISELEHHSNLVPWQEITQQGDLTYLTLNNDYTINFTDLPAFDVVSLVLASNVTGGTLKPQDIEKLRQKNPTSIIILDASQVIGHMPFTVANWDADFVVFSGHKMYGPTGIGVVYGKQDLLEKTNPSKSGGGMIREVNHTSSTWAPLPEKFEAGTPPIAQAIGLAAAVKFIEATGIKEIRTHEIELSEYLGSRLSNIKGLHLFHPKDIEQHAAVFSFTVEGVHAHDLSQILGDRHIAVRAGHHCAQILHKESLRVPATTRVSLGVYNSKEDIDKLITGIKDIIKMFE